MHHDPITIWLDQAAGVPVLVLGVAALAGLLMGFAPSSLPLYSVVGGYVGGNLGGRGKSLLLSAGFVLGMASVDTALGVLFGFLGYAVIFAIARYLALTNLLVAVILVVLGLALLRKIAIVVPVLRPKARPAESFAAAYALGVPFGLSACPACTPMVLPILGAAAATGTPWLGGLLLFVFALARGIPLLVIGAAAHTVKRLPRLTVWFPTIERVSGALLLVAALYFLYQSATAASFVPPLQFLL